MIECLTSSLIASILCSLFKDFCTVIYSALSASYRQVLASQKNNLTQQVSNIKFSLDNFRPHGHHVHKTTHKSEWNDYIISCSNGWMIIISMAIVHAVPYMYCGVTLQWISDFCSDIPHMYTFIASNELNWCCMLCSIWNFSTLTI